VSAFDHYSAYYNLLYRDKDYRAEADYVGGLIREFHPKGKSLLELGCGTGKHAELFRGQGYQPEGVDMSATMLDQARKAYPAIAFHLGDARKVRLNKRFDIVTSLFHVASYQTSNEDLAAYMATAREHLNQGGLFVFDFWYGPGVLSDPPAVRVKRLEDENASVLRIAEPTIFPNRNVVNVHYDVQVRRQGAKDMDVISEDHAMRYFFAPELDFVLSASGFKLKALRDWMKADAPAAQSWTAVMVAEAV